ncbi:hypothetical protein VRU48_15250 [Pedobacter sp. KR3-3]|uniref:Uncharacterized protein n=1 Tax=Pedobacter albus TaxID=3113905 RepID=A0ABU7IAH3_9SPHI|nr:hypothetical protein [Pedobacter sp. KR3-3]MEE1946480.1 hypothetical protein [Pedobacter sp. KR3-3]
MKKTIALLFKLIAFVLLCCLFLRFFGKLDLAATKNNGLIIAKQLEIAQENDVNKLKGQAKEYLNEIRQIHRQESSDSVTNMLLLSGFLACVIFLWRISDKTSSVIAEK